MASIPLPRMTLAVGLAQVRDGEAGVVLEGVELLVTEQLLDVVHVRPAPDQLRSAAPAEGMGSDVDVDPGTRRRGVDKAPEDKVAEASAVAGDEESLLPSARGHERAHSSHVALEGLEGCFANRDNAFLAALPVTRMVPSLKSTSHTSRPSNSPTRTPQGGVVSPVLANIYSHYALDLWFERVVKEKTAGQAMMMRYADDFVAAFERRESAEQFLVSLQARLGKFDLKLATGKTCVVQFNRREFRASGGFEFLGFRYHWERTRSGRMEVQRRTSPKRLQRSVARFREWIKENRHERLAKLMPRLTRKLMGDWNYYGVPTAILARICKVGVKGSRGETWGAESLWLRSQ